MGPSVDTLRPTETHVVVVRCDVGDLVQCPRPLTAMGGGDILTALQGVMSVHTTVFGERGDVDERVAGAAED